MRGWLAVATAAVLLAGCSSGGGDAPSPTAPGSATGSGSSGTATTVPAPATVRDWPTYHGDLARTGVSTTLPASDRLSVSARLALDQAVYASPIVVGGLVIVATENNTVYAFDVANRQVWKQHLGTPSPADERPCGNIDPLGITGTPVYDAASGLVFVATELGAPVRHQLVALDPRTGAVRRQNTLDFPGVDATVMQERGALTVAGGRVWVPFGGLAGDCGGYKGRVIGYPTGGAGSPAVFTVPTTREAGIWTPPGPSVDQAGRLLVAVGNGEAGPGGAYDYSDSVLALDTSARRVDSFSPTTWATDNAADLDLGSQGPTLVGPWVFSAGKSGTAYVLRLDHLGGIGGEVSQAQVCTSFGGTAVSGSTVYVPCSDGVRAVTISSSGAMTVNWHADDAVTGSPIIGGGRVWSLDPAGTLHALDPQTGKTRAQVAVGATSRFATPAVRGSDLLVPTLTGLTVVRVG